ncbi:DUF1579 domain-containing protein [uncultured Brevundimonas sp.]|uniref:DUF1579 domain-containing protein n=1 Tax=uncultured Brevundimonas sp. TaxID=213418 RepID=UPI0030EE195F|tara:strand:+ start:1318 stop:1911 length:594 start_codon:yes stop_codon:yes gene_type:complete
MLLRMRMAVVAAALLVAPLSVPQPALAQAAPEAAGSAAQRQAIAALDRLDGTWRGEARMAGPGGQMTFIQTERVGSLLGGSIKVIEGRGYNADGTTSFNAMAVISWDETAGRYAFHSWANGRSGDFPFEATADGFRWEVQAGPGAKVRYVAVVQDGRWHEVGHYIVEGQPPRQILEMTLTRLGDSDWPAGGAVDPGH